MSNKKIDILFDAFKNNLAVKVVRDCFEKPEICVGMISTISRRKPPYGRAEEEICFSMEAAEEWYMENDGLLSLSPWISQVTIEYYVDKELGGE